VSAELAAGIALGLTVALIFLRVPVALVMLGVGAGGYGMVAGWPAVLSYFKTTPVHLFANYGLSIVPLFLLMGAFAGRAGISRALFDAARAWFGHKPGGLAIATIGASAGFGAICGSSLATAATMGQVALPELRRHGYRPSLATGTLAAGGALGVLVPPSLILVLFALIAEVNIAKLFLAAIMPAIVAAIGYGIAIRVVLRFRPDAGPALPRSDAAARWRGLIAVWPVIAIFLLVIVGINAGWFTPTEGAAVGAAATGLLALLRGGLDRAGLVRALLETAEATAMIFAILLGADMFKSFLGAIRLPQELGLAIGDSGLSPWGILLLILALYLVLGAVMESLSMMLLTLPIFFPIVSGLDFGMTPEDVGLWFGILTLVVVEVGLISPPFGLNIFVINALARDVPITATWRGVLPFVAADIVRIGLLLALPPLALALVWWTG
jgi:tripartite ATP-independent transporter DctM subunit